MLPYFLELFKHAASTVVTPITTANVVDEWTVSAQVYELASTPSIGGIDYVTLSITPEGPDFFFEWFF